MFYMIHIKNYRSVSMGCRVWQLIGAWWTDVLAARPTANRNPALPFDDTTTRGHCQSNLNIKNSEAMRAL